MSGLATCLWFDGRAEEAARFYVSLLPGSGIDRVLRYPVDTPGGRAGDTMLVEFHLAGRPYQALNAGPFERPTAAYSFSVPCETQQEVDELWEKLTADGGKANACGWLWDRYGFSWQIVPTRLMELIRDENRERAGAAMRAMMEMVKIDIAAVERAVEGI